ncbi:GIY-YIG nuclease family protein [Fibrobacter sp. UWB12]|uniref:GIY-YIG nuclease family protein n=1 Tax=Fibrobacter sp. UWB12 TaxID=1896203 RepID=UPI000913A5D1|nr:GIY-YIG nuclease family protein [Fibrobacter sp. UWB12]SHK88040.1 putative endonuclease [Fibrobacter sp. UWB12]
MNNNYYVYILTNKYKTVFYTGVTNDLHRRTLEHKMKLNEGFSEKYNADCLAYYELFFNITDAIKREERLKRWNRKWKMELIETFNPQWKDLFVEIGDACSEAGMTM